MVLVSNIRRPETPTAASKSSIMNAPLVVSVIVTYHPEPAKLAVQIKALGSNSIVVVVDNTERDTPLKVGSSVHLVHNGRNGGIAAALNQGVQRARALRADIVAIFDQDSVIEEGFISRLTASLRADRPGVVAAVAFAACGGEEYPSHRLHPVIGWRSVRAAGHSAPVAVDVVISSGSAATIATYDLIGEYHEALFIDLVDVEWCLRCRAAGIPVSLEPSASLTHNIGMGTVRALGVFPCTVHSARRTYYKVRNPLLVARLPHCPISLAMRLIVMSVLRESMVALSIPSRDRFLALAAGIRDGVCGYTGPWTKG